MFCGESSAISGDETIRFTVVFHCRCTDQCRKLISGAEGSSLGRLRCPSCSNRQSYAGEGLCRRRRRPAVGRNSAGQPGAAPCRGSKFAQNRQYVAAYHQAKPAYQTDDCKRRENPPPPQQRYDAAAQQVCSCSGARAPSSDPLPTLYWTPRRHQMILLTASSCWWLSVYGPLAIGKPAARQLSLA